MSVNEMRGILKAYYKRSTSWSQRVDKMSDGQVQAIYFRWKQENKI